MQLLIFIYKFIFNFIGPLNTLIQVLLTTIFDLEEDEEADMKESHISGLLFCFDSFFKINFIFNFINYLGWEPVYNIGDEKTKNAVKLATNVRNWSMQHLGQQLNKLPLQSTAISEVLRIHLLSSGGKYSDRMAKWM